MLAYIFQPTKAVHMVEKYDSSTDPPTDVTAHLSKPKATVKMPGTDDPSGSHHLPSPAAQRGGLFTVDVKHIIAVATIVLGLGGVGGGVLSVSGRVDTDKIATKDSVEVLDKKLDMIGGQLNASALASGRYEARNDAFKEKTEKDLNDLEARMRSLEERRLPR